MTDELKLKMETSGPLKSLIIRIDDFQLLQRCITSAIYRAENTERAIIINAIGLNYEGQEALVNHDKQTGKLKHAYNKLCRLFEQQYE